MNSGESNNGWHSMAGHLLIAAPEMIDDYFAQTVVLVFQHSEEGAAGVVLNRPSDIPLNTVWTDLDPDLHVHAEEKINIGGPCEGPLIAIHNSLVYAELPIVPGVTLTTGVDNLKELVKQPQHTIRLFSGYAGWSSYQLDSEINQGGWYSIPARPTFVFSEAADMWRLACAEFGDDIISLVAGHHLPDDPSLN